MIVQRYPFGLLSLLDAKSTGVTPSELAKELQSVLAVGPFYFGSIPGTNVGSDQLGVAITANTGYALLTVPANQAWQIITVAAVINNASAAVTALTATLNLGASDGTGNTPVAKLVAEAMPNASKYLHAIWTPSGEPQIFGPGTRFSVVLSETIAVTTLDTHIRAFVRILAV